MSPPPEIILFTYALSPFGRRTEWYLILRGIPYARSPVRDRLPREVLQDLDIKYRRIPILAIGRDIYCDTRLIISKLEELFPEGRLGSESPAGRGVEGLLESWVVDRLFWPVAMLIPPDALRGLGKEWADDRSDFMGGLDLAVLEKGRPEAQADVRRYLDLVERDLLGDGRQWLLGGQKPSLAEIHTVWILDWLLFQDWMVGAIPDNVVSEQNHPGIFALVKRFKDVIAAKQEKGGKIVDLSREQTVEKIWASSFYEKPGEVDVADPLKLKKGQVVEIWPLDSGSNHRDKGELVSIGKYEVVVESKSKNGSLRIHYPRTNIRVAAVSTS